MLPRDRRYRRRLIEFDAFEGRGIARLSPTLRVDFLNNTQPDAGVGTITYSGGANGTRIDSGGLIDNKTTPRIDYDPETFEPLGLLIEEARENVVLQSSNFSLSWAAVGTPTRAGGSYGLGDVTLDLIGDDSATVLEGYTQTIGFTGDAQKAISLIVAKSSSTSSVVRLRDTTAGADRLLAAITWSGDTPVITMTTGTQTGTAKKFTATGTPHAYLIEFLTTSVTAASTNSLQIYPATDAALDATATGTIYAGCVQAENALSASSHIPTTTATVTRTADSATDTTISWFNPLEGTIVAEVIPATPVTFGANQYLFSVSDGTTNDRIEVYRSVTVGGTGYFVGDGGVAQVNINSVGNNVLAQDVVSKIAAAYKANDFAISKGGNAVLTDTSGTVPTVSELNIGANAAGTGQFLNGHIRLLEYNRKHLSYLPELSK